jgi:hypothetical protein
MSHTRTRLSAALCLFITILSGCSEPSPEVVAAEKKQVADFQPTWKKVAAIVTKNGGSVEAYEPDAPYTMRITMPGQPTAYEARKTAKMVRESLHEKAIVYVSDDTGKRLAKAAPWGIE